MSNGDFLTFTFSPVEDDVLDEASAEGSVRECQMYHFLHPRTNLFHPNNLTLSHFLLLLSIYVDSHMVEVITKRESTTHCLRVLYNLSR